MNAAERLAAMRRDHNPSANKFICTCGAMNPCDALTAVDALAAVLALHQPGTGRWPDCLHCSDEFAVRYPCPTVATITDALGAER